MGDRFIPFRGAAADNFYIEEYILNNDDPFLRDPKKPDPSASSTLPNIPPSSQQPQQHPHPPPSDLTSAAADVTTLMRTADRV